MARVLVVEDEDVTRQLLERRSSGAGHGVRTAGSADGARVALRRELTVTCRVLSAVSAELAAVPPTHHPIASDG